MITFNQGSPHRGQLLWLLALYCPLLLLNACASRPASDNGWEAIARQHLKRGEFSLAITVLEAQRQHGNRAAAVFVLLDRARAEQGQPELRLARAEEGLLWYPQNADLSFGRVYALIDLERYTDALTTLEQLAHLPGIDPRRLRLRTLLAQMEISSRREDEPELERLLAQAELEMPGITQALEAQRVQNARPAANLPAATIEPWLSSHPTWERRIQEIQKQKEKPYDHH